jgi:GNAT superfamily N-acetyltransferase
MLEIEILPSITIRKVDGTAHADELNALQKECLPGDKMADVTHGGWWIAYDGNKPVAFAGTQGCTLPLTAYLVRSGVLRSHRGMGLQKRLIRARCAHAKRLGYRRVVSDTSNNPASSNALIACGFRLFEPAKPWGLKSSIYFRKALA